MEPISLGVGFLVGTRSLLYPPTSPLRSFSLIPTLLIAILALPIHSLLSKSTMNTMQRKYRSELALPKMRLLGLGSHVACNPVWKLK